MQRLSPSRSGLKAFAFMRGGGVATLSRLLCSSALLGGCSDAAEFTTRRATSHDANLPEGPRPPVEADAGVEPSPTVTGEPPVAPSMKPPIDQIGDVFLDPGCPEAMQRFEDSECDPLGDALQCGEGMGCFPYVDYPTGPCEPETFETRCASAGTGVQGEECSGQRCAHGFLCVVTSRGTECAELCKLPGDNTCADGFICGSLDIDGYGVCI